MNAVVKTDEPTIINYPFRCKRCNQKLLIDVLLKYSTLGLAEIAILIDVSIRELESVHRGNSYLEQGSGVTLAELFLVCFSD